jgi:Tfp pilus assembly PilM family ATPase
VISWSTTDIAGIEFGDAHIAAARVREKRAGSYQITHAGWVDYDPAGSPKDKAEAIKVLWKHSKMPTRTVCAALRSGSLTVRSFSFPAMTPRELSAVIWLQAEEAMQLSRSEMVVEWHINRNPTVEMNERPVTGFFAAAPLKDIDAELEWLRAADLDPVILDIRALAVANLRGTFKGTEADECSQCLVNLAPHSADIILQHAPGVCYPHTVYCRASTWEETPEFLAENIRDVMRYGEFKLGWKSSARVVLMGQMEKPSRLPARVHELLGQEVQVWVPWEDGLQTSRAVDKVLSRDGVDSGILLPALGLALRRT